MTDAARVTFPRAASVTAVVRVAGRPVVSVEPGWEGGAGARFFLGSVLGRPAILAGRGCPARPGPPLSRTCGGGGGGVSPNSGGGGSRLDSCVAGRRRGSGCGLRAPRESRLRGCGGARSPAAAQGSLQGAASSRRETDSGEACRVSLPPVRA